jgi:hypothetical protein
MTTIILDEVIKQRAKAYADRLTSEALKAKKEEEIRIASEHELAFLQEAAKIKLEGKHEYTVASGFVDSVYDRVIIEYKNPNSPSARIGSWPKRWVRPQASEERACGSISPSCRRGR